MATNTIKTAAKTKASTEKNVTAANSTVKETPASVVVNNEVEEPVVKSIKTEEVKIKKTFTDSDYILCKSVWAGGLNIISQSGNLYEFNDYGAECEINYRDLVTLIRRGSDHIFIPRFVILDEDFLADFPTVQKIYGAMYTMEDLKAILDLPTAQMSREIEKLPDATKNSMRTLIATQIANGKLDSIAKVRELSTIFDSDFNLLSDLFVK